MSEQMNDSKSGLQAPKLTTWASEPTTADLNADFLAAKSAHDAQMLKIQKWSDLMKVEGSAKPKAVKGRSSVQPKLIRRQAEWRYSALTEPFHSSNKLYNLKPTSFEDKKAAEQNELVLNYQFKTKINRVKFIDDLVRSVVDEGTAIVRVGWLRTTAPEKKQVPVFDHYNFASAEEQQEFELAVSLAQENPRMFEEQASPEIKAAVEYFNESGEPTVAVQNGTREIVEQKIIENRPTLQILNPRNVMIDPSCEGDIDRAMFVIVSFETSKAELQKNSRTYKNLDHVNWEAATPIAEPNHTTNMDQNFQFKDAMRKRIVAYEYWGYYDVDGKGETLKPIVATWIGDVMIRMEENPFPDKKLPFVVVPYLPIKRELYGEPDAELLEDNQKILGAVSRGMIDLLGRSANGQQGFAKGMLDVVNRRRFENGQDYEFNPNTTPLQGHIQHQYPEIPNSALTMLTLQNQEAESLTGVKGFAGGMSGEAYGDVAAGIRGVLDASSKREMAILRRIAKGVVDIGRKITSMNGEFLSEKEVVRVTNDEFVTVNRDDLIGEYDIETDISTAEIDNAKAQDLGFMLQTIGPNLDFELNKMILADIAKLKRMPDLAKKLETFERKPDPMQQKLMELEIKEKELSVAKLESEIELNRAKAKKEEAQADKANLDFVEQETGTKHAREMEKQRGQAEGNQDLEITKNLVKPIKEGESKPNVEAAIGYNALSRQKNPASESGETNLGSKFFDPRQDPALNPAMNL